LAEERQRKKVALAVKTGTAMGGGGGGGQCLSSQTQSREKTGHNTSLPGRGGKENELRDSELRESKSRGKGKENE